MDWTAHYNINGSAPAKCAYMCCSCCHSSTNLNIHTYKLNWRTGLNYNFCTTLIYLLHLCNDSVYLALTECWQRFLFTRKEKLTHIQLDTTTTTPFLPLKAGSLVYQCWHWLYSKSAVNHMREWATIEYAYGNSTNSREHLSLRHCTSWGGSAADAHTLYCGRVSLWGYQRTHLRAQEELML